MRDLLVMPGSGAYRVLARSRMLRLAGVDVETPLLIPAVSSRALGPIEVTDGRRTVRKPASAVHTDVLIRRIDGALLVSAHDIQRRLVDNAGAFQRGFKASAYATVKVMFIDSGWYEKGVEDSTSYWYPRTGQEPNARPTRARSTKGLRKRAPKRVPGPFGPDEWAQTIDSLDPDIPAVVVSWDHHGTYGRQIRAAQDFFGSRDSLSSDLLLKPPKKERYYNFTELSAADAQHLAAFGVIGVTEKELGDNLRARLVAIADLRRLLDGASVDAPIHVFGGLDPLLTPLYVAAGAEIFDGLTWLRYGFHDGLSISTDQAVVMSKSYDKRFSRCSTQMQMANLTEMEQLAQELKAFVARGCDWSKLPHEDVLRPAHEAFEIALKGSKNGR